MRYYRLMTWMIVGVAVVIALGGCNTIRGLGRDVERGGQTIQDTTR